jgi:hypothetical protein
MDKEYRADYPKEPIGGGNPYWMCKFCHKSDPEINGEIKNHSKNCEWRIKVEEENRAKLKEKFNGAY